MSETELKHRIREDYQERKKRSNYLGWAVTWASIVYSLFIVAVDGYLVSVVEPYFQPYVNENLIGGLLLAASIIKLAGLVTEIPLLKRGGIILLSMVWSGLWGVAVTYSFGSGWPHPSFIFFSFVLAITWRVARKGDIGQHEYQ